MFDNCDELNQLHRRQIRWVKHSDFTSYWHS